MAPWGRRGSVYKTWASESTGAPGFLVTTKSPASNNRRRSSGANVASKRKRPRLAPASDTPHETLDTPCTAMATPESTSTDDGSWHTYLRRFSGESGEWINLSAIEGIPRQWDVLADTSGVAGPAVGFDSYYGDVPADCSLDSAIPSCEVLRKAFQVLDAWVQTADEEDKRKAATICSDLLVELVQLGTAAIRQGQYADDDLLEVVQSARHSGPAVASFMGLDNEPNVVALLRLLLNPIFLHNFLLRAEHKAALEVLVACLKNLLLELTLPRTPSPADHAAKAEVLMRGSLAIVGARSQEQPK